MISEKLTIELQEIIKTHYGVNLSFGLKNHQVYVEKLELGFVLAKELSSTLF